MSPKAQRIAIAEACGWKAIRMSRRWELSDDPGCPEDLCGRHPVADHWSHLPDYLNDLNAMHEAEKVLTEEGHRGFKWGMYRAHLIDTDPTNDQVHATAADRAQSFLKTLSLWDVSK